MAELAPWLTKEAELPLSQPPAESEKLPLAPWVTPPANAPWLEKPIDASGPMPGPIDAAWAGVKRGISDIGQSAETISGKPTPVAPDTNPAAAPYEWRDLAEPIGRG